MNLEKVFKKLDSPNKIQDFLDKIPFNFEKRGETYRSPAEVLKHREAHCFEGALFALACLHFHNKQVFLLDLKTDDIKNDADHAVTLFQEGTGKNMRWGAVSKTNHAVLRWRDPIYLSVRELAVSYFHEYFLDNGRKTLISFSTPFDVIKKFGTNWIKNEKDLDEIALALDQSKHHLFYSPKFKKFIRKASKLEIKTTSLTQFSK